MATSPISDRSARALARAYAEATCDTDPNAPLARLAATGEIDAGAAEQLHRALIGYEAALLRYPPASASDRAATATTRSELAVLLDYVRTRGPRGPVPGWSRDH